MKKLIIINLILFFVLSGCAKKEQNTKGNYSDKLFINNIPVSVEIVSSFLEMQRGLSERDEMCENCGMLFIMNDSDIHNFWMGKMRFALDFAYIENNKIIEIFKNVPIYTSDEYTRINSTQNSDMVLELNAGFLDKNNIKAGDEIKLIN
ncbi:MAG: DUF192 domain-containing protein [Patescibacteria group bacterium]|nr:DUF192 domain-containing protein [Patescibacteria group bacterium]